MDGNMEGTQGQDTRGEILIKTIPRAGDAGFNESVFGGWLMEQLDLAGSILAKKISHTRTAMVAADSLRFLRPVAVGDVVTCYGRGVRLGKTSLTVRLEIWAMPVMPGRDDYFQEFKAVEALITYVAIDDDGQKRPIDRPVDGPHSLFLALIDEEGEKGPIDREQNAALTQVLDAEKK